MARLFAVETPLPGAKPDLRARTAALTPGAPRRPCAGGDGPWRDHLHAAQPGLRHLPAARPACRAREGHRRRPAPQGAEAAQAHAPRHRLPCPADGWRVAAGNPARQGASGRDARLARQRLGRGRAARGPAACRRLATTRGWRCATPSPISTCAWRCGWRRSLTRPGSRRLHPARGVPPGHLPTVMRKAFDLAQGAWPED